MEADVLTCCALALAVHGLAALPPCTVEILGLAAQGISSLGDSRLAEHGRDFFNPPASRDSVVDEDDGGQAVFMERQAGPPTDVRFLSRTSGALAFRPQHRAHVCPVRTWPGEVPWTAFT
eukprot:7004037-Pyramimonas_sp.AAC.1